MCIDGLIRLPKARSILVKSAMDFGQKGKGFMDFFLRTHDFYLSAGYGICSHFLLHKY